MKKIKIIGAGMAGLSAGCYLQMNGYETEIFEMHSKPGGLCASWERNGYLIDGCVHWFVGGNPDSGMHTIWNELIDMKTLPINTYGEFCSVEVNGRIIRFYSDLEELKNELIKISPEDSKVINEMTAAAKKFLMFDAKGIDTFGGKVKLFLNLLPMLIRYKKWTAPVEKYAERFKHPLIKKLLTASFSGDVPMIALLFNSSWFHNKNAGYPIGGARELISRIVQRYESLGGKLNYKSKVAKIVVENGSATGIQLENRDIHKADIIISAADGHYTVFNMLEEKYKDKKIQKLYYNKKYEPKMSTFYVSLGVARKFDESFKPYVFFALSKPLVVDKKEIRQLGVTIHNFDPKAAPEGKTVLTVMVESVDPAYWIRLREADKEQYEKQKDEIARHVIDEVERHFGNIKNNLETVDVATPATYVRYTNNWNGAPMGWQDFSLFFFKPRKEIQGLKNFYMCGQWVGDGGLPTAAKSGRDLTQIICKKDRKPFTTLSY